jgi:hypothetical protein
MSENKIILPTNHKDLVVWNVSITPEEEKESVQLILDNTGIRIHYVGSLVDKKGNVKSIISIRIEDTLDMINLMTYSKDFVWFEEVFKNTYKEYEDSELDKYSKVEYEIISIICVYNSLLCSK